MSSPKLYRQVWVWTPLAVSARVSTIAVGVAIGRKVGWWPLADVQGPRNNVCLCGVKRT